MTGFAILDCNDDDLPTPAMERAAERRRHACQCDPDMPGRCPGPGHCPYSDFNEDEEEEHDRHHE